MRDATDNQVTVGVVVLNWQEYSATRACLDSLLELDDTGRATQLQIVVCDNNSQDNSAELLKEWISECNNSSIEFLATGTNGGYAYGNKRGIAHLLKCCDPDYIWILNNDVEVSPSSLRHLLDAANDSPEVVVWGSTIVDHADRSTIECGGGYRYFPATGRVKGNYSGIPLRVLQKRVDYQYDFDYVSGAAMFCQASVFEKFGLLNEDYFLYFEEYDLVKRIGGQEKIYWCPKSVVYHICGLSISGSSQHLRSSLQQYYENLNTFKFTHRFYKGYLLNILLLRLLIKPILFTVRREWHLYGPFFCAVRDFFCWLYKGAPESIPAIIPEKIIGKR